MVIPLKFGSLKNMRTTSSESKDNLGRSRKRLITSLGINAKARPNNYQKVRYYIVNVSEKDLSKIIREFDRFPYETFERRRPKHEPAYS